MSDALLLDTHIWVWYVEGCEGVLSAPTLAAIDRARQAYRLYVSAISVWKIGMLCVRKKISLSAPTREWIHRATEMPGLRLQILVAETAFKSTQLLGNPHGDPADRSLIVAARVHNLHLVTADRKIRDYGKAGYVQLLGACST